MTKLDLQKELLEKIKQGIKPSDLKKPKLNTPASSPPVSPIIVPVDKKNQPKSAPESISPPPIVQEESQKVKQLQEQVNFHANTAQTHLTNLQRATAENDYLKEQIKELQSQPNQLSQEIEQALKEANQKIRELEEKNKQLAEKHSQLEKQTKIPAKGKETKIQSTQTELPKTFALKNYSCQICFENRKGGVPSKLLRVKGLGGERNKKIWVCFLCRKQVIVIYDEEENWRNF